MIKVDRHELARSVVRITLAAPHAGNALNGPMVRDLTEALVGAAGDAACRAILIAAEGPEFCRGLDLEAAFSSDQPPPRAELRAFAECLEQIACCAKPVVACVEGRASGGGVGLVAACDIVLATPGAQFILPEVIVGMIPAMIAPILLQRLSVGRLRSLAVGSRPITAAEAHIYGLVDELVESDMPAAVARQMRRLERSYPRALTETKRFLRTLGAAQAEPQMADALETLAQWTSQAEVRAGIRCFAEGLAPPWFQNGSRSGG